MTTSTATTGDTVSPAQRDRHPGTRARRSPRLSGRLPVLRERSPSWRAISRPGRRISGAEMQALYAANPGPLQFKSLGFHWAYAFWLVPPADRSYVRGKGAWLANATALIGFVGLSTMPGLLMADWFHSAIGQAVGGGLRHRDRAPRRHVGRAGDDPARTSAGSRRPSRRPCCAQGTSRTRRTAAPSSTPRSRSSAGSTCWSATRRSR